MNKTQLLRYLANVDGILVGQHLAYSLNDAMSGYADLVMSLHDKTDAYPALVGLDYATGNDYETGNQVMLDWHNAGGIVTIEWMANNPWTGGRYDDTKRGGSLSDLLDASTAAGKAYLVQLEELRARLSPLYKAGVPVLFRPFHECTFNGSYWWDCQGYYDTGYSSKPFIDLWRYTHDYLSDFDNLLWVYCAANTDEWTPLDAVYPGPEYVDIVGVDVYSDTPEIIGGGYKRLVALGKPVAMCEIGPYHMSGDVSAMNALQYVRDNYPAVKYVQWWHDWEGHNAALISQQDYDAVMQAAWAITRDVIATKGSETMSIVTEMLARVAELRGKAEALRTAATELDTDADAIEALAAQLQAADKLADELAEKLG